MNPKCVKAVNAAAIAGGRKAPTKAQLQEIEDGLAAAKTRIARQDPAKWGGMTEAQRLTEAAALVMQDIQAAAAKKLEQAHLQIEVTARVQERLASVQQAMRDTAGKAGTRAEALSRDAINTDQMATVLRKESFGRLLALIEASQSKQGASLGRKVLMTLFDAENPGMTRDVIREVYKGADGHTQNPMAKAAARAWLDTIEELRTRFNAAGGDVGQLDYGYTPQPHDTVKVRKAGADAWAAKVLPLLDRSRYLREDGSRMADDELLAVLKKAHTTLATEGLNKSTPGQFQGSGKRANRHSDTRQIHFADGEAWSTYMRDFGRGSIYDAMMGHIGAMARDITLVERYGPDFAAQVRLQLDEARVADGKAASEPLTGAGTVDPATYFKIISGQVGMPASERLARNMAMVRNLQTAAKLGGAVISSVTDLGTLAITAGYNRLPYWQLLKDVAAQTSKDSRDFMATHGMIAESVADSLNRWSGDHLGTNWSGKLSNAIMRASLLNAWTDGLRQGFTLTMNAAFARMAKTEWANLAERDRTRLARGGFTEADWKALQQVQPAQFKGRELLTPDAIRTAGNNDLAQKVFGFIHDESEFAIVNPDLTTRAIVTGGGQQAGTVPGEIVRTTMQFKSFPIAMITRHWRRMMEGDLIDGQSAAANRMLYGVALLLTSTALGAVAFQSKQMLAGKDPISMDQPRFWLRALAQGGGLAIAGDLFLIDPSSGMGDSLGTLAKNVMGPTFGTGGELALKVITENIWQEAAGKDSHWEAELFNWAKSNTPGQSLWWMKPVVDHTFMNAIQENLSPGYLARVQKKARQDWGTDMWWAPADATPARAPDVAGAFQGR